MEEYADVERHEKKFKMLGMLSVAGLLSAAGLLCARWCPWTLGRLLISLSFWVLLGAYVFLPRSKMQSCILGLVGSGLTATASLFDFLYIGHGVGAQWFGHPEGFCVLWMLESVGIVLMAASIVKINSPALTWPIASVVGLAGLVCMAMLRMLEAMTTACRADSTDGCLFFLMYGLVCWGVLFVISLSLLVSCLYRRKGIGNERGMAKGKNGLSGGDGNPNWFSWGGRISRGDFWWRYIDVILVGCIVGGLIRFCISSIAPKEIGIIARFIVDYFIDVWCVVLLTMPLRVRRLHDRGISGKWVAFF